MWKNSLLILLLTTSYSLYVSSQLTDIQLNGISEILKPVSDPNKPGVSAAIVKDGKIIFSKSHGLANFDIASQADENSLYQIDALSQQFTSSAFLKLIESGTVNLNDDIKDYLPELPSYKYPILIKHILNHTSGLNNYEVVHQLTGAPFSQGFNNSMAIKIVASQQSLTHKPGEQFSSLDSKTESLLMSEIISRTSGMSFSDYVDQNVFSPLKLNDAIFISDNNRINLNKAIAYEEVDGSLRTNTDLDHTVGPTNLYISIADLSKWYSYFSPNNSKKQYKLVKQLDTPVTTDNGDVFVSGWGKMTIGRSYLHLERGLPKYWQYGLKGGYGANVFRFSDIDLISIVLGNNSSYNGMYAMSIVSSFTEAYFTKPASVDVNQIPVVPLNIKKQSKWTGEYFNPLTGQLRQFEIQQDTFRYFRGPNWVISLLPINKSSFQAIMESDDILKFHFGEKENQRFYDVSSFEGEEQRFYAIDSNFNSTDKQLELYSGMYLNEDLGQIYTFSIKDNQLIATHNRLGDIAFRNIKEDLFVSQSYALSSIQFHRKEGVITHFNVKTGGIKMLTFNKVLLNKNRDIHSPCFKTYQQ